MNEDRIKELMLILDITREDAIEMIADDAEVDKMTSMKDINNDLTDRQKKASKEARITSSAESEEKPRAKRERKIDSDKQIVFNTIKDAVSGLVGSVEVTTADREMVFTYADKKFKITLAMPRK